MTNDLFNGNQEMQRYFSTLPAIVQETLLQSGAQISTLEQLQQYVSNFTENNCQN